MVQIDKPLVSVNWLKDNSGAKNLVILDASIPKVTANAEEANDVQIPGARFFDIKHKFSDIDAPFPNTVPSEKRFNEEAQKLGINSNSAIVVYDDKGIYSSARCWYLFKAFGHQNIAVLDGGLPEWISRGFSVERKKDISYPRGDFKGYYHSKYFNFFDDIEQLREDPGYQILDARSGDRFNGLVAEPREGLRSGNIPNSRSLPFKDLLDGNGMKPVNELKEILRAYNIEDKSLVFSCGSGITACVLALAAAMAGYKNTSVYDGSWTEYGTLTHD